MKYYVITSHDGCPYGGDNLKFAKKLCHDYVVNGGAWCQVRDANHQTIFSLKNIENSWVEQK